MDRPEVRGGIAPGAIVAPLHFKSNGGTLLFEAFGRQRTKAEERFDRRIVSLVPRYDFLDLPIGKSIQVSFNQHLISSRLLCRNPRDGD